MMKRNVLKLITLTTVMAALPPICYAKTVLQTAVISPIPVDFLAPKSVPTITDVIDNFFGNNVVLGVGIDFLTGESVVLDSFTGKQIAPCDAKTGCGLNITGISPELNAAIELSNQAIKETIKINGSAVEVTFVVSVTATYKMAGQNCVTYLSGGEQFTNCVQLEKRCNEILPSTTNTGYAGGSLESQRRSIRQTCRQFSLWKSTDCAYLKAKYNAPNLTNPVRVLPSYSTRYKQYIWKTCKGVVPTPASWGACPAGMPSECTAPIVTP